MKKLMFVLAISIIAALPTAALADSISPSSFVATIGVGGSASVHKTVTIDANLTTSQNYSTVSISDLGAGLPGVSTTVVCTSAAPGGFCSGDHASGSYDRSILRTFGFDVTFTGIAPGTYTFNTDALVGGGIVAQESDTITVTTTTSAVPEPTPLVLVGLGLAGVVAAKRRKDAQNRLEQLKSR